jgi:ferrous iron transport protein B
MTAARVALLGNPNTGKTSLFNRLCGARAKTANFPGTTTSARVGHARVDGIRSVEVLDLPGIYELGLQTPEARIVRDVLSGADRPHHTDAVIVIVDAANLARNLVLVGEVIARGLKPIVALNMIDVAARRGWTIDAAALAKALGVPVVPMIAPRGVGVEQLRATLGDVLKAEAGTHGPDPRPTPGTDQPGSVEKRYDPLGLAQSVTSGHPVADTLTERLDRVLTHPLLGLLAFFMVMAGLFWTLFQLAAVPMDLIDTTFAALGSVVSTYLPAGPIRDLLADGVIGGIAGTVVFLPQICFLFFLISLLEDTGYLARAAFVMDRFLRPFGLPGHAFVPLLTSHACALPGIMATRLIPDRRDRLAAILVAPFMSCSARIPVFALLTSLLFVDNRFLAGIAFAGCFVLGAAAAFMSALLFSRTIVKGRARPMILELPSYQVPSIRNALMTARDQGLSFLKTAGTVIMAICVVMWWLSAHPKADPPAEAGALRAQAATAAPADAEALVARADALEARTQQTHSFAGRMGRLVQPVFEPLGYDWQLTVGVLTSFIAREVFVSTMAVLASDQSGGEATGVIAAVREMPRDDGSRVLTRATSASALVFFVLAMQCLPTLAVTRRETGKLRYAALQLGYMSGVAYVAALIVYQALRAAGVS